MRFRTTLFLLLLVGGLAAFVLTYERKLPGTKVRQTLAVKPFDFKAEEVDHLEITAKDRSMKLERKEGQWQILKPYQDRGNPELVEELIRSIGEIEVIEKLTKKDLKSGNYRRTGLSGNNTVKLVLQQGEKILADVSVGSEGSIEESAYLSIGENEEEFFLAKTRVNSLLPTDLENWRDPHLTRFKTDDIQKFIITSGNGIMEFAREKGKPWQIVKPLQTRGSTERINAVLNTLLKLEVKVTKSSSKAMPLASGMMPEMKIQLEFFGNSKPETIILRPGTEASTSIQAEVSQRAEIFDADPKADSFWKLQPNHLRDQNLAHFETEKIEGIQIETTRFGKVELTREGLNWFLLRHGKQKPARTPHIIDLLTRLLKEQVVDFVSDTGLNVETFGLHQPFMQISLKEADRTQLLKFGSDDKGRVFAKYQDEPFIYQVNPNLIESIPADPIKWQSLKVIDANLFTVRRIIIAEDTKPVFTLYYQPETGSWTATAADQDITDNIDAAKANELLQKLVGYEVQEWVSERSAAYQALKNPTLTLQLLNTQLDNPQADPIATTLRFAPMNPGINTALYYGQIEGELDPFYITRAAYTELLKLPLKSE